MCAVDVCTLPLREGLAIGLRCWMGAMRPTTGPPKGLTMRPRERRPLWPPFDASVQPFPVGPALGTAQGGAGVDEYCSTM
eukprot:15478196-Alexandrium_andersonii.AAC.1